MDAQTLAGGLLQYMMLIILLTFHEFGHAWTALKCGDDTARLQGRVSLNPIVHIDPIGTVLMPLLALFFPGMSRILIGWAKPVPVNPYNLHRPKVDDILVTLAGPGMNLLLAVVIMLIARIVVLFHAFDLTLMLFRMANLSLILCFFNLLLPIPPLDGSQVVRVLTGMSLETYARLCMIGPIVLICIWQIPQVSGLIGNVTNLTLTLIAHGLNFPAYFFS
jgi:Zn-dependent protease